jgi:hypothetical protein
MSLFQHTILKKHLTAQGDMIAAAYALYKNYFLNPEIQENIRNSKEEQFQEGFLRELFVKVLGYTLNPGSGYCKAALSHLRAAFVYFLHHICTKSRCERSSRQARLQPLITSQSVI